MMANCHVFVVLLSVLVCDNISLVQCDDECKTNADCKNSYNFYPFCCGGYLNFNSESKSQRSCTYSSCLNHYCSNDTDCSDSSMCCRSNECVKKGCSGCSDSTDCASGHVCCKKTFPFDETVCAANCIHKDCNSNDDCTGYGECCRSGKCTDTGCSNKCKSNSECNSKQYCCTKATTTTYWETTGCAQSCVGKICNTDEDCGAANECCISNKCVDRGCSGCTTNSNCSSGQYCCKKRQSGYELSECSADCIGKSCSSNHDCGGPGETCDSNHRCTNMPLPPWVIAVITVILVVFLVTVGILLAVIWNIKRKRAANASQAGTVPLHNTRYQGAEIQTPQPQTSQFSGLSNPLYQETTCQNQPGQMPPNNNVVAHQPPNSTYYPQGFQSGAQNPFHNQLHNPQPHTQVPPAEPPAYQTVEFPNAPPQDTSGGQQMYPQNTPYEGNNYPYNPPYNPLFQGNH